MNYILQKKKFFVEKMIEFFIRAEEGKKNFQQERDIKKVNVGKTLVSIITDC